MHGSGVIHGDLHLENIMWVEERKSKIQAIDFGASLLKKDMEISDWKELKENDEEEILREAGLLQINRMETSKGSCFKKAIRKADELFPQEIADLAKKIKKTNPD